MDPSAENISSHCFFPNHVNNNNIESSIKHESYNEIATKLLNEKLVLTALELHAELCEAGKELPLLRDYFSNANNFENYSMKPDPSILIARSSSQATLDSLDMTRFSEDDCGMDERVAVLEFELRKARANILALRANLTMVTESAGETNSCSPTKQIEKLLSKQPIKPHEEKALNFLVYEYLLAQSYKLTSITFSDENENQDFEDWEDVGLNIPKPPDLLYIYREFINRSGNSFNKPLFADVSTQTDKVLEESLENKNPMLKANDEPKFLDDKNLFENIDDDFDKDVESKESIELSVDKFPDESSNSQKSFDEKSEKTASLAVDDKFNLVKISDNTKPYVNQDNSDKEDNISVISVEDTHSEASDWSNIEFSKAKLPAKSLFLNLPARFLPEVLKEQIVQLTFEHPPNIEMQMIEDITKINSIQDVINILSRSLIGITPNVISNKKFELIPLLLMAFKYAENGDRDNLLSLLFNLKKKPHQAERKIILKILMLAMELDKREPELEKIISLCWEQSQHKYPEKRLLAVECYAILAPYAPNDIRNSLIISMLQQILLDDKEPVVRCEVVKSLALLVALTDDAEKYFQFEELTFTALDDESSKVYQVASSLLLPILAQWALFLNRFFSHLMNRILSTLKNQLMKADKLNKLSQNDVKDNWSDEKILRLVDTLIILLPYTIVCVADTDVVKKHVKPETPAELPAKISALCRFHITNPVSFSRNSENIGKVINAFLEHDLSDEKWPEFEWITEKLITEIIAMIKLIDFSQEKILFSFLNYLQAICNGFCNKNVQQSIKNIFANELTELERLFVSSNDKITGMTIIPAYISVLATAEVKAELIQVINHLIYVLSINQIDIICLTAAVKILCNDAKLMDDLIEALFGHLRDKSSTIRCTIIKLFSNIILNVNEKLLNTKIAPVILSLVNDTDVSVKSVAIVAIGKLITECNSNEMKEKGRFSLETFLQEFNNGIPLNLAIPIVNTFANIALECPQDYTENVILPKLLAITSSAHQNKDVASALVNAFSIVIYCAINDECIAGVLMPGLKQLEGLVNQVLPAQKENVRTLIRQVETKYRGMKATERPPIRSSTLSLPINTSNVGQGVEDIRQRVTKMFTPTPSSPALSNIFRKK